LCIVWQLLQYPVTIASDKRGKQKNKT